jgi:hypothetical protein
MFRKLRVNTSLKIISPDPTGISISQLIGDASLLVTIMTLNSLHEDPKRLFYRTLIPIQVLANFAYQPIVRLVVKERLVTKARCYFDEKI